MIYFSTKFRVAFLFHYVSAVSRERFNCSTTFFDLFVFFDCFRSIGYGYREIQERNAPVESFVRKFSNKEKYKSKNHISLLIKITGITSNTFSLST